MNRYPLWKYIFIAIVLTLGTLYTLPNFFGESPAVQISSGKATVKIDATVRARVEDILQKGGLKADGIFADSKGTHESVRARFADIDTQFKAKGLLEKELNPDPSDPTYIVAFNLLPNTPKWLQSIRALPMYLGLDLRGGVHFLMQVDTKAVLNKHLQGVQAGARSALRDKNIRHAGIGRNGDALEIKFREQEERAKGKDVLAGQMSDLAFEDFADGSEFKLVVRLKPEMLKQIVDNAVQQNITTLSNRVNELGVSEPIIQRQGADRIVVQLPGVQDVSHAKDILGRTATLEARMVDESIMRGSEDTASIPAESELFKSGRDAPVVLYRTPILTGDYITSADARIDQQNSQPTVDITLNSEGGRKMLTATRGKIGKLMAMVLFEKGKGEVLTVATIQAELGSRFVITGQKSIEASRDLALLLRAGSLAAPMEIIEERTIGPQLGAENIKKGFYSTMYGFAAIALFMMLYYGLFGFFSVLALGFNLLLLVAMLSGIQATLTLPGMAAIALALGMAIDANVLINERIREELRAGNSPQAAIAAGFDRAWATILDSNVTTLIVGIALYTCGSGAIKGFALVHCLGILTSIFSAVFVSRGVVNLWYGRRKKLASVSIGQVWKPAQQ